MAEEEETRETVGMKTLLFQKPRVNFENREEEDRLLAEAENGKKQKTEKSGAEEEMTDD